MMRLLLALSALLIHATSHAQPLLKAGDLFPAQLIRPLINAPVKQYDVQLQNKKLLILNFWGTWCSPCLPEMDSLSCLQRNNKGRLQVIAISDEPPTRLQKYLQRKPSLLWLASDTTANLYRQFGFSYVGQSAIVSGSNRIIALVRTDSINQHLIDRLLLGETVSSSAEAGNRVNAAADLFAVDSTLGFQVSWGAYRPNVASMRKTYLTTGFEGRRVTYFNACLTNMYKDAYGVSNQQVIFEVPEKTVCNWDDKSTLYCLDLLVKPAQKDSLQVILQQTLERLAPVKVRRDRRMIPVYVLRRLPGAAEWTTSTIRESTSSFSGQGFEGKGILLAPFVDYLSNELGLPVVDETGLTGKYDITTENTLRTKEDVLEAVKKLGLVVEKTTREMDVIAIYR